MSINSTVPTPTGTQPRDAMMRAFAVAEQVVAQLPDQPTTISLEDNHSGAFRVALYFHRAPECVVRFAAEFDTEATAVPHLTEDTATYTSAECTVSGVRVQAWALVRGTAAGSEAVAA
ncbi:hypothetical protein [Streptomyces thermolilacinus]|uniref:hypothetical protein n=1 Tax=Streptomyces thermolilacinus TaxID=285540 RepID=UPI0033D83FCF